MRDRAETCENGVWGACLGSRGPVDEVCDGLTTTAMAKPTKPSVADADQMKDGAGVAEQRVTMAYGVIVREVVDPASSDDLDNDCDGDEDENITRACGHNVGECRSGLEACDNGEWDECEWTVPLLPKPAMASTMIATGVSMKTSRASAPA